MPPALLARVRPLVSELAKFAVVGGICFVIDATLAYVFHFKVGLGPTTAKALSTAIAVVLSYVGNRLWSFAHRIDEDSSHGQDLSVYLAINVVGLVVTLVPVDITHYLLHHKSGLAFNLSGAIGTGFATIFRFWAYRRYVFAGQSEPAELAALV